MSITVEEWLAELDRLSQPSKDALTIKGWAQKLDKNRESTSLWIKKGLECGWMERSKVLIESLTGAKRRTVGFRLVEQKRIKQK